MRSAYLAEANVDAAGMYAGSAWGPGWAGAGWFWDPWFSAFTFVPADGIFYSPFGWGFYSPWLVYQAPIYGYGHFYHQFSMNYHNWGPGRHYIGGPAYAHGTYRGPGSVRAFHSGSTRMRAPAFGRSAAGGVHSGGFHGSGFHGGGMHGSFGGFHGGGFHGR